MLDIQLKHNILQALLHSKEVAIALIDKEYKWAEWNEGMLNFSGLPKEKVLGKNINDLFRGFHTTKHYEYVQRVLNGNLNSETSFIGPAFWAGHQKNNYCFLFIPLKKEEGVTEACILIIKKVDTSPEIEKDKVYTEYKTLAENSGIGIWRMDREGFTEYANPSMCEILGIKNQEEIKGQMIAHFFTPASLEKMAQEYYKRLNNISSTYEVELIRSDGSIRNVMIHGSPLINKEGHTEGLISTIIDITESKISQNELIRSEKRFRSLFEQTITPTGISRNGFIMLVNQALADLFGESKESMIGKSVLEFLVPEQRALSAELIQKRMNGESVPQCYEHTGLRKDGTTFEFQLMVSFIDFPDGLATVLSIKDISEQKKAEKAIRESEAKFRGLFEGSIVGVMFADGQGKIIDANKRFLEMIGYDQQDLENGELTWQKLTPPEYFTKDFEAAKEVVEKGFISPYEKEYIKKDGSRIPVLITSSLIKNSSSNYGVGFIVDLTELKKSKEETVKVANELSTFLYMASHDLKGPLASVIGLTNVAEKEIYDPKALEYLNLIRECTLKLDASLMNFLKIIRIKNNTIEGTKINFYELISEIISSLKHQITFEEVIFKISVTIHNDFYSDEDLIRSIIQNLLDNAVKYKTRLREAEVNIAIEENNNELLVMVEDNGRGIDENIKDKIFNIFYRGDISSKGSGLGLYIVKSAAENLKGSVSVVNKPSGGCIFSVRLPYIND